MLDCIIATCTDVPELDPDDRLLLHALRARGMQVAAAVWSDPDVDWSAARLCLLRSTWDYPRYYDRFTDWLERLAAVTTVRNDAGVVRWNSDKRYLRDLAKLGVPVVPTSFVARDDVIDITALLRRQAWREAILKPSRGAAGWNVSRISVDGAHALQAVLRDLLREGDVLVQPYVDGNTHREHSLVFIGGAYTHAIYKEPFDTKLAIGDAAKRSVLPAPDELEVAHYALRCVPGPTPLYARVDLFRNDDGAVLLNEIELIEPALYLGAYGPAVELFADAVLRELR